MTEEEQRNRDVVARFLTDVLGRGDLAVLDEVTSPDVVVHSGISPLAPMRGREEFRAALGSLAAFTFVDFAVEDLLAVQDRVCVRYRALADHTGDQLGVPATGKRVTMWEIRVMRLQDGLIVEDFVADINYDWPWLVSPAYPDAIGRTGREMTGTDPDAIDKETP